MLKVTDIARLAEFGFVCESTRNWHERPIFYREIGRFRESRVYLVVNPYEYQMERENELELVMEVGIDRDDIKDLLEEYDSLDFYCEFTLNTDALFDMMLAGVLEYRREEKCGTTSGSSTPSTK